MGSLPNDPPTALDEHLDEGGAITIEYGTLVALVALVLVGAATALELGITNWFDRMVDFIANLAVG
jgi:Flp pilus assembly pilin Flp